MSSSLRVALLAVFAAVLAGALVLGLLKFRMTPDDKERRRRGRLHVLGRMRDGMLMEVDGPVLHYTYSANGVDYHASQDISTLPNLIPPEASLILGPVTIKYLVRNPANSILVCETWSGLRLRAPKPNPIEKESV